MRRKNRSGLFIGLEYLDGFVCWQRSNHCYHHVTISRKAHEINQIVTAFICQ